MRTTTLYCAGVFSLLVLVACGNSESPTSSGDGTDPSAGGSTHQGGDGAGGGAGHGGGDSGRAGSAGSNAASDIATVAVEGATVAIGVVDRRPMGDADIGSFRINKHPVTVGEYLACDECGEPKLTRGGCDHERYVPLGPCFPADTNTYFGNNKNVPVTCLSPEQMAKYCASIGGEVATLGQWLLAARGKNVAAYPWGSSAPTKTQHPYGEPLTCVEEVEPFEVGNHPEGAGPSGMEDILVPPAEFALREPGVGDQSADRFVNSNVFEKPRGGVHRISYWIPEEHPDSAGSAPMPEASFRCVWSD